MNQLESALEAIFVKRVRLAGGLSYKLVPTYSAGIPDRLVLFPMGRIYLVELKADGGELRDVQKLWHARAAELGIRVYVVTGQAEAIQWVRDRVDEVAPQYPDRRRA